MTEPLGETIDALMRRIRELEAERITCAECKHSNIQKHTGDDVLVCWVRKSFGERVPGDGYCYKAER